MILIKHAETGYYIQVLENPDAILTNTHNPSLCEDRGCAIHDHPSDHPLNGAPLNWRNTDVILERICEHGMPHPDRDSATFEASVGNHYKNEHDCDGCCGNPTPGI